MSNGTFGKRREQLGLTIGQLAGLTCIDAERLERVSGNRIVYKTVQKGNRKECGCFASRDIGEYDTCPHGCVYCYAVQHRDLSLERYKAHDPTSEFLFPPRHYIPDEDEENVSQLIPALTVRKRSQSHNSSSEQKKDSSEVEQGRLFET